MTYTFLRRKGYEVGQVDRRERQAGAGAQPAGRGGRQAGAGDGLRRHRQAGLQGAHGGRAQDRGAGRDPADWEAVDAGPATVATFTEILLGAKTIVWNGPVGVFEIDATAKGTIAVAEALAKATAARRDHHHRRRRLGVGGEEGGRRQQGVARLDRRRRVARVPRGQGAAGGGGADGQVKNRTPLPYPLPASRGEGKESERGEGGKSLIVVRGGGLGATPAPDGMLKTPHDPRNTPIAISAAPAPREIGSTIASANIEQIQRGDGFSRDRRCDASLPSHAHDNERRQGPDDADKQELRAVSCIRHRDLPSALQSTPGRRRYRVGIGRRSRRSMTARCGGRTAMSSNFSSTPFGMDLMLSQSPSPRLLPSSQPLRE